MKQTDLVLGEEYAQKGRVSMIQVKLLGFEKKNTSKYDWQKPRMVTQAFVEQVRGDGKRYHVALTALVHPWSVEVERVTEREERDAVLNAQAVVADKVRERLAEEGITVRRGWGANVEIHGHDMEKLAHLLGIEGF